MSWKTDVAQLRVLCPILWHNVFISDAGRTFCPELLETGAGMLIMKHPHTGRMFWWCRTCEIHSTPGWKFADTQLLTRSPAFLFLFPRACVSFVRQLPAVGGCSSERRGVKTPKLTAELWCFCRKRSDLSCRRCLHLCCLVHFSPFAWFLPPISLFLQEVIEINAH